MLRGRRALFLTLLTLALAGWWSLPARACSLSLDGHRRALRSAHRAVAACGARFGLPPGRYVVGVAIDPSGKATEVAVRESPGSIGAAAESCVEMAFTLPAYPASAGEGASARSGGGRLSRVPSPARMCEGPVQVRWPFVLR
ncbi:MAG: hypothetical protein VYE22_31495 [Myxococcota bacterium]|nr:hypothetical protein [Myxococcota bacterium]